MIAKLGAIVSLASGNLGSVQFASGRGTPVVKMRRPSSRQLSPDQQAHQLAHATAAASYNALSDAHKFAWKLYALKQVRTNRLGTPRKLSAFQLWMQQNTLRVQIGAAMRTNPPKLGMSGVGVPAYIGFEAGGSYRLYLIAPSTDTTGYYVVYGHRPLSMTHIGRVFKHVVYSSAVITSIDVDISTYWGAKLGLMQAGEKYWLSIRYLGNSSLASAPLSITGTVT